MWPTSDDKLAAAVFASGLSLGFVRREDVVRWADRRIGEMDIAPPSLIDLSLSQHQQFMDLISALNEVAKGVDPVELFRAIFGLIPDTKGLYFDEAEALAWLVNNITRHCITEWQNELFRTADHIDDTFSLVRSGCCIWNQTETIEQLTQFIEKNRDLNIVRVVFPAAWSHPCPAIVAHRAAGDC